MTRGVTRVGKCGTRCGAGVSERAPEAGTMCMVRVRRHEDLADVIPGRVNKVPGVTSSDTHISFQTYSKHDLESAFAIGW